VLSVWFRAADADRDGAVTLEEMRAFHATFDPTITVVDLAHRLRRMDREGNSDARVQFTEFCAFYGVTVPRRHDAWEGHGASKCCLLM
jgi:Ca2+-binding EF-hand superfamily protein